MCKQMLWIALISAALAPAQAPVVEARGVVNGVTLELAPSTVAPGGIFNVYGFNLAPATVLATRIPLPTTLGTPGVEVLVNGRPAPLYFVSATQINAQVPFETEAGPAQVVVRRGGVSSRAATLVVQPAAPSLFALNGAGFGPAIAVRAGRLVGPDNPPAPGDVLVVYAAGLGPVEPAVASGAAGPSGPLARVNRPQRAFTSGFPAAVQFAGLAPGFVGLFQINLQLSEQAVPGDVLQYFSGPQMANRLTLGSAGAPHARLLRVPDSLGNLLGIADSSLNGGFAVINGQRGGDGCYQEVWILDFRRDRISRVEECLIHANQNVQTPFIAENESAKLAALIGPAAAAAPAGISSRVLILDGATGRSRIVDLPAPALALQPAGGGQRGVTATLPGEPPRVALINTDTGEVQILAGGQPGPAPGGAPGGGAGGAPPVNVDGLTQVVSTVARLANNRLALVVADNETNPTRAIFVVVSPGGEVQTRIAFPDGYLPLMPPRAEAPRPGGQPPAGGGGMPPGGGQPGGQLPAMPPAPRANAFGEPQSNRVIVAARSADNTKHALAIFDVERGSARAADFPSGAFAASCSPQLRFFNLTLSRKLALALSDRLETAAATPCASTGLLLFDLAAQSMSRVALPSGGTLDVNSLNVLDDYLYGVNADRLAQISSSLFVFDGSGETVRRIDAPRGSTGFAGLQPIASLARLLAMATNRQPGDEGLILFDLANATAVLFPAPAGFARVANPGLHSATRKLTARGIKPGTEGSQVLVFDITTGAATALANPEGVLAIGSPAAAGQQQQARVIFERNQNSNSILAAVYGEGNRPLGLVVVEGF